MHGCSLPNPQLYFWYTKNDNGTTIIVRLSGNTSFRTNIGGVCGKEKVKVKEGILQKKRSEVLIFLSHAVKPVGG